MQAFGDNAEIMANTRLPYSSDDSRPPAIPTTQLGTQQGVSIQFGTEHPPTPYQTTEQP